MASVVRDFVIHSDNGGHCLFLLCVRRGNCTDARDVSIIKGVIMALQQCYKCGDLFNEKDSLNPTVCDSCVIDNTYPSVVFDPAEQFLGDDRESHAD